MGYELASGQAANPYVAFSSVPDVVARALAVLLVKRHRVFVGHIGRAGLQGLHRVDAGAAIFEICPVEFEAFLFLQLVV